MAGARGSSSSPGARLGSLFDFFGALLLVLPESLESTARARAALLRGRGGVRLLLRGPLLGPLAPWPRPCAGPAPRLPPWRRRSWPPAWPRPARRLGLGLGDPDGDPLLDRRPLLGQLGVLAPCPGRPRSAAAAMPPLPLRQQRGDAGLLRAPPCLERLLGDQVRGRLLAVRGDLLLESPPAWPWPPRAWPAGPRSGRSLAAVVSNIVVDHCSRVCRSAGRSSVDQQGDRQQVGLLLVLVADHLAGQSPSGRRASAGRPDRRLGLGQAASACLSLAAIAASRVAAAAELDAGSGPARPARRASCDSAASTAPRPQFSAVDGLVQARAWVLRESLLEPCGRHGRAGRVQVNVTAEASTRADRDRGGAHVSRGRSIAPDGDSATGEATAYRCFAVVRNATAVVGKIRNHSFPQSVRSHLDATGFGTLKVQLSVEIVPHSAPSSTSEWLSASG